MSLLRVTPVAFACVGEMSDDVSQIYARGLEQLRINWLLLEEACAKHLRGEFVEALELREEAVAYEREGRALLDAAMSARLKTLQRPAGRASRTPRRDRAN